jgi:hypothetical protein
MPWAAIIAVGPFAKAATDSDASQKASNTQCDVAAAAAVEQAPQLFTVAANKVHDVAALTDIVFIRKD